MIQTLWKPVPGQLNDYIKEPKENNYRSIHAAVYTSENKIIEIQIRTFAMDQESEHMVLQHIGNIKKAFYTNRLPCKNRLVTPGYYLAKRT